MRAKIASCGLDLWAMLAAAALATLLLVAATQMEAQSCTVPHRVAASAGRSTLPVKDVVFEIAPN